MIAAGAIARTAGVLGHELRNPLAAAVTGAALLRELIDVDDPRRGVVDGVAAELQRLGGLLDSYLDLARCARPQQLPVAVAKLVETIARRRPQLTGTVPVDLLVRGDALLLERALENLVENAVHVGAQRVQVTVQDGRHGGIALVVEDDGPGVPPTLRARIFAAGYSRCGSTGLGLGIVAEVVRAHAGTVRCEACDRGARFVIELPSCELAARR